MNNDGLPAWFWLLILFGAGWFISALMDAGEPTRIDTASSNEIDYITLDGMPCAIVDGGHEKFAISCDWTKWNGQIEDGVITFPLQNTYEEPIVTNDNCGYVDEWDVDHYKEPCDDS